MSDCGVRGARFESHCRLLCLPQQLLRYSLGHGLHILTAVPRSTQPSTHHEMAKWVLAFGLSNNKMAMVDVDGSSLLVGSQPKLFSLVRGLVDTWRWVCIHQMNWVNSRNGSKLLRQHHKYHPGYYYYYCYHSCAFSALTLLVGRQEGHLACKNRVVRYWRGYLSGARCRFAYGPADATATHCLLLQ